LIGARWPFLTSELTPAQPEAHADVQLLHPAAYRRALEAVTCGVRATLLLPVFESPARSNCAAVLEVVLAQGAQFFNLMAQSLSTVLEVRGGAPSATLGSAQACGFLTTTLLLFAVRSCTHPGSSDSF
jgi:hypothetical protein